MFIGFQDENFSIKSDTPVAAKDTFFQQYLSLREMDPLDAVCLSADYLFGKFCQIKYALVVHEKMEASFFGNLDQWNFVIGGGHPSTVFYQAFLKLAQSIWLLHRFAHSFDPSVKIFQVKRENEFSEVYLESVVKNFITVDGNEKPKVGLMVMPGFWIGGSVIESQVYLTELLGRKPIFPSTECLNQLKLIISILGSQSEQDFEFIDNPKARRYVKTLSYTSEAPLARLYNHAYPLALDLLQKMLVFDPTKRISVTEALQHPYIAPLYVPRSDPPAQVPICLDIDEELGEEMIKEMMWEEILYYHPEASSASMGICIL